jgi:hypothetical protein
MRINTEASVMIQSLRVRAVLFLGCGSYRTSVGGSLLRAEGFSCSLAILHGGLETNMCQFNFIKKNMYEQIFSCKILQF